MYLLAPAELLRFLEEEATTLCLMSSKVANQLHFVQVEEELLNRQRLKLEQAGNESGQIGQDEVRSEGTGQEWNTTPDRATEQVIGPSPTLHDGPVTERSSGEDEQIEEELLNRQSVKLIKSSNEAGQNERDEVQSESIEQESNTTPLDTTEHVRGSSPMVHQCSVTEKSSGDGQVEEGLVNGQGLNQRKSPQESGQNELSKGIEQESKTTTLVTSEQLPGSSPTPHQCPVTENSSGGDGQVQEELLGGQHLKLIKSSDESGQNERDEVQSEHFEQESNTTLLDATEQMLGSNPTLHQCPVTEKSPGGDGQEASTRKKSENGENLQTERGLCVQEIISAPEPAAAPPRVRKRTRVGRRTIKSIELQSKDALAKESHDHSEEQEIPMATGRVRVKEIPMLERTTRTRISRLPARFRD